MLDKPKFLTGEVKEFIDIDYSINYNDAINEAKQIIESHGLAVPKNLDRLTLDSINGALNAFVKYSIESDNKLDTIKSIFLYIVHRYKSSIDSFERNQIKLFLNQPFDTAMIEKYFKGWDCVLNDTEFQTTQFSQYVNILIEEDLIINHTEKLFCIEDWELMIPQTLNHFISDCIRAGIKLEWRE